MGEKGDVSVKRGGQRASKMETRKGGGGGLLLTAVLTWEGPFKDNRAFFQILNYCLSRGKIGSPHSETS